MPTTLGLVAVLLLLLPPLAALQAAEGLHVYPPVPGLAASEHYTVRVRASGGGEMPGILTTRMTDWLADSGFLAKAGK